MGSTLLNPNDETFVTDNELNIVSHIQSLTVLSQAMHYHCTFCIAMMSNGKVREFLGYGSMLPLPLLCDPYVAYYMFCMFFAFV